MSSSAQLVLQATLLSLIPGMFWLWFVESHRPVRGSWVRTLISFLGGAASTLAVIGLSYGLEMLWPEMHNLRRTTWGRFAYFVVIVGLMEEFCKLMSVRILAYHRRDFREAWDGLAASSAAALGFATAENVKYILDVGTSLILLPRSVLSTMGHVLMSGIWGYALGLARAASLANRAKIAAGEIPPKTHRRWILPALLTSALGHGAYDFFLIQELPWLAVGVLALLWAVFWSQVKDSVLESQRRLFRTFRIRECADCHSLVRSHHQFCTNCGHGMAAATTVYCQQCLEKAESGDVCAHCGATWV